MSAEGAVVRPQDLPEFSGDLAHCDACEWPDADTAYVLPFEGAWTGPGRRPQGPAELGEAPAAVRLSEAHL